MPGRRKIKNERRSQWIRFVIKLILLLALLELFLWLLFRVFLTKSITNEYLVVGVSGGLQDGFPEHSKLNFDSSIDGSDPVPAIFLGRALVRGYKAFLDVMEPSWRQYVPEPGQPLINSNVFASGCYEHANEYWIYLVDSRQVMTVLNNEPRFLSITPDTGQLDLNAPETSTLVRDFMQHEIQHQGKTDSNHVAVPLVTAVWFNEKSHVPSPPIHTHKDGTQVTNFPESLALWANVNDSDRTAVMDCDAKQQCSPQEYNTARQAEEQYWNGIRKAIRVAESKRSSNNKKYGPPFKCQLQVRFGVGNDTARLNYPFSVQQITSILDVIGYTVDYTDGKVYRVTKSTSEL